MESVCSECQCAEARAQSPRHATRPDLNTLSAIEEKRIRHDEQRRIVAYLRRRTEDPEIVFQRVVLMDFVLNGDRFSEDALSGKELATMLGVTEARVSIALSRLLADLENFGSVNFSSTPAHP
jgi:hypothetical protein